MKSAIIWFSAIISLTFIGCLNEASKVNQIFLENSPDFNSLFLEDFFTDPSKNTDVLALNAASLQVAIEDYISKGRARRNNDTPRMGNASGEYCRAAKLHRERLAEIILLQNVSSRSEWERILGSVDTKLKNFSNKLPETLMPSKSISHESISKVLKEMYEYDQSLRSFMHWKNFQGMGVAEESYFRSRHGIVSCEFKLLAANKLKQVFRTSNGWPKISSYGEDADKHAFVILHNLGHDLDLLEYALGQIEILYKVNETQK